MLEAVTKAGSDGCRMLLKLRVEDRDEEATVGM